MQGFVLRLMFSITGLGLCFNLSAKEIAGVNEVVTLLPEHIALNAKLDTGADSSSIDARNIEYFTKNDNEWVRFTLARDRTIDNKQHQLEFPLAGTIKIVARRAEMRDQEKSYHRRPVINMDVCIGDEIQTIEVNLIDRSNFQYPFLLGASGLEKFNFLVDVQEKDLLPNTCTAKSSTATDYKYLIIMAVTIVMVIAAAAIGYQIIKR